jgi:hypothetical protein
VHLEDCGDPPVGIGVHAAIALVILCVFMTHAVVGRVHVGAPAPESVPALEPVRLALAALESATPHPVRRAIAAPESATPHPARLEPAPPAPAAPESANPARPAPLLLLHHGTLLLLAPRRNLVRRHAISSVVGLPRLRVAYVRAREFERTPGRWRPQRAPDTVAIDRTDVQNMDGLVQVLPRQLRRHLPHHQHPA